MAPSSNEVLSKSPIGQAVVKNEQVAALTQVKYETPEAWVDYNEEKLHCFLKPPTVRRLLKSIVKTS